MRGQELKNAAALAENGVNVAICTDYTVIPIQYLPISAQAAVKGGLDSMTALRALTTAPAEILGAENIGSLTEGKDADIQLYRKGDDPLSLMSEPVLVMINGEAIRREV